MQKKIIFCISLKIKVFFLKRIHNININPDIDVKRLAAKILNANDKGIKDTIIIKNLSIRLTYK